MAGFCVPLLGKGVVALLGVTDLRPPLDLTPLEAVPARGEFGRAPGDVEFVIAPGVIVPGAIAPGGVTPGVGEAEAPAPELAAPAEVAAPVGGVMATPVWAKAGAESARAAIAASMGVFINLRSFVTALRGASANTESLDHRKTRSPPNGCKIDNFAFTPSVALGAASVSYAAAYIAVVSTLVFFDFPLAEGWIERLLA